MCYLDVSDSNLIKNDSIFENSYYDFNELEYYPKLFVNKNASFHNPIQNDFRITQESEFLGLGNKDYAADIPLDLKGADRTTSPDLGALQHVIFEEEDWLSHEQRTMGHEFMYLFADAL